MQKWSREGDKDYNDIVELEVRKVAPNWVEEGPIKWRGENYEGGKPLRGETASV